MNLLEATVTKILGEPKEAYGKWWVLVEYECYGRLSEIDVMSETKEGIEKVKIGYKFNC